MSGSTGQAGGRVQACGHSGGARTGLHPVDELVPRVDTVHILRVLVRALHVLALVVEHEDPHLWVVLCCVGPMHAIRRGMGFVGVTSHALNVQTSLFVRTLKPSAFLRACITPCSSLFSTYYFTDGCVVQCGNQCAAAEMTKAPTSSYTPHPPQPHTTSPHAPRWPTPARSRSRACS